MWSKIYGHRKGEFHTQMGRLGRVMHTQVIYYGYLNKSDYTADSEVKFIQEVTRVESPNTEQC